ncbi:MAG: PA2779 family protein [Desulfobulbaceae bacterium]|jgi:hypothetical protein|nr:PA2779 family protein [Desulfobulbaceae bacterium]MDY0351677.1 PA2779 family protein [Desulfobulbaceae bacterium]
MLQRIAQPMSIVLIISFLLLNFAAQAARAEMISTETAIALTGKENSRATVAAFLERMDVRQTMERQGVDMAEAMKRVNALSDEEVLRLAQQIDQLPAGGNGFGTVVGAILVIFLVLLITDILGLTHVFSFVNR